MYIGPASGHAGVMEALEGKADVEHSEASREGLGEALRRADALVDASMSVAIDGELLRGASRLLVVSCASTGDDHVDRRALGARGIRVLTLREDRAFLEEMTPTAEHAWGLILASARGLVPAVMSTKEGLWERERFPGTWLRGKTLGLVGCGRLGQWVGGFGEAFGMDVVGADPYIDPWPERIERRSLADLARSSDVISLHVGLDGSTRGLVGRKVIDQMKSDAILVNTSRGEVIDENALIDALEEGRVGRAALDVISDELNPQESRLLEYSRYNDRLIVTPHLGGFSPEAVRMASRRAAEKVNEHLGRLNGEEGIEEVAGWGH